MESRNGRRGRKRNVFKGSVLVSILIEVHPRRFRSRAAAVKFARKLLRQGHIRSIFGSSSFEDSAQLYVWQDDDAVQRHRATMTSSGADGATSRSTGGYDSLRQGDVTESQYETLDAKLVEAVKNKVLNRTEAYNIVTSYNNFFQELQADKEEEKEKNPYYNQPPQLFQHQQNHQQQEGQHLNQQQHQLQHLQHQHQQQQQQQQQQQHQNQQQHQRHHPQQQSVGRDDRRQPSLQQRQPPHPHPHPHHSSAQHNPHQGPTPQQQSSQSAPCPRTSHQVPPPSHPETPRSHHPHHRSRHQSWAPPPYSQAVPQSSQPAGYSAEFKSSPAVPVSQSTDLRSSSGTNPQSYRTGQEPCPVHPSSAGEGEGEGKRESTCSTDSSLDTQTYFRTRDRNRSKHQHSHGSRSHSADGSSRSVSGRTTNPSGSSSGSAGRTTSSATPGVATPGRGSQGSRVRSGGSSSHRSAAHGEGVSRERRAAHHNSHPHTPRTTANMSSPANTAHPLSHPHQRHHSSIPEERPNPDSGLGKESRPTELTSSDYEMTTVGTSSASHPQGMMLANHASSSPESLMPVVRPLTNDGPDSAAGRWPQDSVVYPYAESERQTAVYSYSDNEKQLMEEMRRMKREHQDILRTYEGRINKLMAKMHELRSIAEMLENSSTKTSPYGLLPAKTTLLNTIASGTKLEEGEKKGGGTGEGDVPPPLPPRPGRGGRIYPNRPIIHTRSRMKPLHWSRIILGESGEEDKQATVWHGMQDVTLDTEDLDRLYSVPPEPSTDDVTLLDDIYAIRGRPKHQLLAMFEAERSQRVLTEMRNLRCTLRDVINAVNSLDCRHLHQDSFAELLELLNSPRDVDKVLHHAKRKGPSQLDTAEFLIFEMSKLEHFRERLEFLRFKNKLQINLFEIDQQLRELNTACDELITNGPLKNVLETILSLGNYLNGGSERGQADGFGLDILNKLKDFVDRTRRGNLLELVMRTYCLQYEADLDLGCPTRFRLPEPSNMRHAAQVSFDEIQKALRDLREELSQVRERLEVLSKRESSNLTIALRVSSENFLTSAVEVLGEEKRFLEDTKAHFWKTSAYFHYNRQCSPQEFFQTFATFLHDCKYYWKLAHRNLARDKFERDFSTKCQLSCSSLPGFSQLKDSMMRTVVSLQKDQDMRASKAQQLQHINNWIESLGKYDHDMQPDASAPARDAAFTLPDHGGQRGRSHAWHREQGERGQGRSSSPKPITSTPPNVHKPQPISHVSPTPGSSTYSSTAFPGNLTGPAPSSTGYSQISNYHQPFHSDSEPNEEVYEPLNRVAMAAGQSEEPSRDAVDGGGKKGSQDSTQRKNANFSLKSWLKRDQRQRTSNDELSTAVQSPSQSQQTASKSPTTPFNKLRNTVVHKLAGSGGSKKSDTTKPHGPAVPPKPPRTGGDMEPMPSHQILFPSGPQPPPDGARDVPDQEDELRDYQNFYYHLQELRDRGYNGHNGHNGHNSAPSTLSSVTSREFSPNKYESFGRGNGNRNRDSSRDKSRYGSQDRNLNPARESVHTLSPSSAESPQKESRGRNRAPIALNLGSNMSISDVYGRHEDVERPQAEVAPTSQHPASQGAGDTTRDVMPHVPPQPSNVDSKRVKAQPVPVYKAKLIPNYENQTKLDPRKELGIRGQAEPVQDPRKELGARSQTDSTQMEPLKEHTARGQGESGKLAGVKHVPQASNSSDMYRQELQRKSEMYVNNYPAQSPLSPSGSGPSTHLAMPFNSPLNQISPGQAFSPQHQPPPHAAQGQGYNQPKPALGPGGGLNHVGHPSSQEMGLTPPNHPFSQQMSRSGHTLSPHSTPKGSANSVASPDGGLGPVKTDASHFGPVNPSSQHYDDFQTPARRSASAQNILDRDHLLGDGPRQSQASEPGGQSHSYLAGISNANLPSNRREDTSRTSGGKREERNKVSDGREAVKDQGQDSNVGLAKVSTLITRWEKKQGLEDGMGGGLVDQDKPPSMTSTPVTRRKNPPGGGEREGGGRHLQPPSSRQQPVHDAHRSVGPFSSGPRGPRSQSQPRERDAGHLNPHSHHNVSPHRSDVRRQPPPALTPRTQAPSSNHHPHHPPHHQHPPQPSSHHTAHPHPHQSSPHHTSTNTYPPRSTLAVSRSPGEADSSPDVAGSYKQQGRKAPPMGDGEGSKARPVPLPRHNLPPTAAMAVVKPTVMHQGQLTYMDI